jgi:hypothetical protein
MTGEGADPRLRERPHYRLYERLIADKRMGVGSEGARRLPKLEHLRAPTERLADGRAEPVLVFEDQIRLSTYDYREEGHTEAFVVLHSA